jgi:hypothetical protein
VFCIILFVSVRITNNTVAVYIQQNEEQKEIIASQKETIESLTNELDLLKKYGTMNQVDTNIMLNDIPVYEAVNDITNDTWQNTIFVPDDTYNNKKKLISDNDYPDISYQEVCVESSGCAFDSLQKDTLPNSHVTYEYMGRQVKIPFNSMWGNKTLAVVPYIETSGSEIEWKNVDKSIRFGAPYPIGEGIGGWVPGRITLDVFAIDNYDAYFQNYFSELKNAGGTAENLQKSSINGHTVLRFGNFGLEYYHYVIAITSDNIVFSLMSPDIVTYEQLEDIVRTIQ